MNIKDYLEKHDVTQGVLALKINVTPGFISQLVLKKRPIPAELAISLEKATNGEVTCEESRPDIDWAYLRNANAA